MLKRFGGTTIAATLALSGFVAMGAAGYGVLTGTTPCQMIGSCALGCDKEKSPSQTAPKAADVQLINNETKGKSCCDLAKTLQASAEKAGCCASQSKAQTIAASTDAKPCCAKSCSAMTSCKKALIAREASMPVIMPAAFYIPASFEDGDLAQAGCCASQARTIAANSEKTGGCCSKSNTQNANAATSGCCKDKAAAQTINAASTTEGGCCKGKAQNVNAETSGCCKDKAAAQTINAANATEGGCCKGKAQAAGILPNDIVVTKSDYTGYVGIIDDPNNPGQFTFASTGTCSKPATCCKKALIAREASMPVIMPAAFYIPANLSDADLTDAGCCRSAIKNASATTSCNEAKACCKKGTEVAAQ